jgi:hypothetical protein
LFNFLNKKGFYISFIFDTSYHKQTIFLLHRNHFFTFGLVPTNLNLFSVNFALPISNESVFLHLFFIRTVLHIKKTTQMLYYKSYMKY